MAVVGDVIRANGSSLGGSYLRKRLEHIIVEKPSRAPELRPSSGQVVPVVPIPRVRELCMTYAKPFFDLQLRFASRVAVLSGTSLADTLLDYTNLYARFGLGRNFDATNQRWQEYLSGLNDSRHALDWTYDFYAAQLPDRGPPDVVATFGCFSYARLNDAQVRLHFQNAESEEHSPLAAERQGHRMVELRALFEHIRRAEHGAPPRVVGASWLYNLPAYRRLFPEAYLATATAVAPRFRNLPLWGQFLDRKGRVKQSMAKPFLQLLAEHQTVDGLGRCFQFRVLALESPVSHFYEFCGMSVSVAVG